MLQEQKNHRKMYGNVLYFFQHAGSSLLNIKLLDDLVKQVTTDVDVLDQAAPGQEADTTTITRTRTATKQEAASAAEALRGLALALTTDPVLSAALKKPVSGYLYGAEAAFLTYCQTIAAAISTLPTTLMVDAGYDARVMATLTDNLNTLHNGTGEVAGLQQGAKTVTDALPGLFAAVDAALLRLDRLVHFQWFAQGPLVAQYEALRVLPKTPAHHAFRKKGLTPYDVPQLAYNILDEDVPTPTLTNTGSKGHEVVFYLGATATSRPRPGQGILVRNGKKVTLADYTALGDPATEPFLLVMQTSQLAAGGWRVRG